MLLGLGFAGGVVVGLGLGVPAAVALYLLLTKGT